MKVIVVFNFLMLRALQRKTRRKKVNRVMSESSESEQEKYKSKKKKKLVAESDDGSETDAYMDNSDESKKEETVSPKLSKKKDNSKEVDQNVGSTFTFKNKANPVVNKVEEEEDSKVDKAEDSKVTSEEDSPANAEEDNDDDLEDIGDIIEYITQT